MPKHRVELDNEAGPSAVFYLANGDKIRISFQDVMDVDGYKLLVSTPQKMVIMPRSSNTCEITTPVANEVLERKVTESVAKRDGQG